MIRLLASFEMHCAECPMQRPDTQDIRLFLLAVEFGSLSAAAREANLSASAVSKRISRLEHRLGAQLMSRSTRSLCLTEAGSRYYEHANRGLATLDEAQTAVSSLARSPRGLLKVGASESFGRVCIAPYLGEFLGTYPEMQVELSLNPRERNVFVNDRDLVIRRLELVDATLHRELLINDRYVLCAARNYLKRIGSPKQIQELSEHNCLTYNYPTPMNVWELGIPPKLARVKVTGNLSCNNYEVLVDAALQGVGVAYLPIYLVKKHFNSRQLVHLLPKQGGIPRALWAYYPKSLYQSPKMVVFLQFVKDKYARLQS